MTTMLINPFRFGTGSTIDANTILLAHYNGETNDTTFTDSSGNGHSGTGNGNAKLEENERKFGQSSLYLDGTGDYVDHGDSDDFHFDTSEQFTIECFFRLEALPSSGTTSTIISQWEQGGANNRSWALDIWNDSGTYKFRWLYSTNGTDVNLRAITLSSFPGITLSVDTWYHIAVVRDSSDVHRIYWDGEQIDAHTSSSGFYNSTQPVWVGALDNSGAGSYFQGWIDEVRISNIDRYVTSDSFKVPEYPFGNDPLTAHRYWRIWIDENQSGGSTRACSIGELEMRSIPGGTDKTGSGTASAESEFSGTYPASDAVANNGDAASDSWVSSNSGTYGEVWWKYDFGSGNDEIIYELSWDKRGDSFGASEAVVQARVEWSDDDVTYTFGWAIDTSADWGTGSENRVFQSPECPQTVFQCSFDGTDAATSATDESENAHTITFGGTAQLDTAQQQFGTASLLLDGNSDYVSMADHADFEFGSAAFTVECWVRWSTAPNGNGDEGIIGKFDSSGGNNRSWLIYWNDTTNALQFLCSNNGSSNQTNLSYSWTPAADTWYHICGEFDGIDKYRLYVDGVMQASTTSGAGSCYATTEPVEIGRFNGSNYFTGWIDEVRIQNGRAQYLDDNGFDVPTEAFPS